MEKLEQFGINFFQIHLKNLKQQTIIKHVAIPISRLDLYT